MRKFSSSWKRARASAQTKRTATPQFTRSFDVSDSQGGTHRVTMGFIKTGAGTLTISGNTGTFNAQPGADGVAVFNISAADLNKINQIQFNANGADTVIVNVSGSAISLDDNFLGGTQNLGEHVIWNFPDAQTLSLTTAWGGSVLAPEAAATTSNYIQGSAVFGSLTQNGEMHVGTYDGTYDGPGDTPTTTPTDSGTSTVPEPGLVGMLALGLGVLAFARRRRVTAAA